MMLAAFLNFIHLLNSFALLYFVYKNYKFSERNKRLCGQLLSIKIQLKLHKIDLIYLDPDDKVSINEFAKACELKPKNNVVEFKKKD